MQVKRHALLEFIFYKMNTKRHLDHLQYSPVEE